MKKIYTIVMLMFAVSLSFAQQLPVLSLTPFSTGEQIQAVHPTTDAKASESMWYNYAVGMAYYMYGEEYYKYQSDLYRNWPVLSDRVGRFAYSNGTIIPQIQNFAQVFDFSKPQYWDELYETMGEDIPVPGTGAAWGVDSVALFFYYGKGETADSTLADTLIISYAVNMDQEKVWYIGEKYMNLFIPSYDLSTFTFDETGFDHATVITDKILLDSNYYMNASKSYHVVNFAAPEALKSIDSKVLGVSYGYRPAVENRTDSSIMGKDINHFQVISFLDPRPEYQTTAWGSAELLGNMNTSLFTGDYTFRNKADNTWYKKYCPTIMWEVNHMRPFISLLINCTDCQNTKVADMAAKNLTVYPNPATSTISIELADNSKANVQLFNLVGQVVVSEQVNGQQIVTLNVNNLNSGVYMLRVDQNGQTYTSKVIVR